MKYLWSLLFFLPLSLFSQEHYDRLETLDVQRYTFQITLNDDGESIEMREVVEIKFLKEAESFYLDLVNEKNGKGMTVQKVELESSSESVKFEHQDNQLRIFPTSTPEKYATETFVIRYGGIPRDGLIISKNRHGHKTYFGDNWPNRARNWLATVDHPSDKAFVRWEVTAPSEFNIIANGVPVVFDHPDTYIFETRVPLPTKVMVIAAAQFEVEMVGNVNEIPVSSWVFPEDTAKGFEHYDDAAPILATFIDSIAPYAYGKLANVQSKTRYGGMENASSIFYYESSVDKEIIPLLAHEIAHQWFGNMATEANWHHIWLSEGFATYFTDLYIEWSQGEEAFLGRMTRERTKVLRYGSGNKKPVVNTEITDYNRLLNPNSYEKGAWVLHMLRHKIGYPTFMEVVRTYYARFGGKNALTEDLQGVMEELSGMDLEGFFQQWLYFKVNPEIVVEMMGKKKVRIKQVQEGPAFEFPLEVGFLDSSGEMHLETFAVSKSSETFTVSDAFPGKYKEIVPDPGVKLLAKIKVKD